jgi:hypothetical protein
MKIKKVSNYMALLRNVRNILESDVSDYHKEKVILALQHEDSVKHSMQLPFRYFSAYTEVEKLPMATSKVLDALETALELSVGNLPRLEGTTFITADGSSSMTWHPISEKSSIYPVDIADLLMSISQRFCDNAITSKFASSFLVKNVSTKNGIIANKNEFDKMQVGGATNAYKAIEYLIENKIFVDRIIIFSDMQCYGRDSLQQMLDMYKRNINPNVFLHSVDLEGHGTSPFAPNKKVNVIGGWSDKLIEYISLTEKGEQTLINDIENYCIKYSKTRIM